MARKIMIQVDSISKSFDIKAKRFYGGVSKVGSKQVLNSLSFDLFEGEVLGIIGKNGSGKSTLLKILANIMKPDSGNVIINGQIASILELSMGFNPENSGRDNIRMKCGLYGMSNKDIDSCIEEIILFSEIGDQIDDPLRTYSSGMIAKLAFSVLLYVKCEILIIDEVLSVGDASFNIKSKLAFDKIKKTGHSIIIASHNINTLESMCDRVLWIESGKAKEIGDPVNVCYHYTTDSVDSIETVISLANAGDVNSMNRAGVIYRDGIGVSKDYKKAEYWFLKASNLGHNEAQYNVALLYKSMGNNALAHDYLMKSSESGFVPAIVSLSNTSLDSDHIMNFKKELEIEANTGNNQAMKLLADLLFEGNVFDKNIEEAIYWFKLCSENNNSRAEYSLGVIYRDGIGVQKDTIEAIKWFSLSADHGFPRAKIEIANIYRRGIGIERDLKTAINWYTAAADSGDANAMLQLGQIYREGIGVEQDLIKSEYWFKLYSIQALLNAEVSFGDIIRKKYSGARQKQCMCWYSHASSFGNISASNNLAGIYRDGTMVQPDYRKAFELYSLTSSKNDRSGLYDLGLCYIKGMGTEPNFEKAFELIKKASDNGNIQASLQLFYMYYNGIGTPVNHSKAKETIQILIDQGNNAAKGASFDLEYQSD